MMIPETAKSACHNETFSPKLSKHDVHNLEDKIASKYRMNMILDNLPVTTYDLTKNVGFILGGFPLGFRHMGKTYINNHLVFNILVHRTTEVYDEQMDANQRFMASNPLGRRKLLEDETNDNDKYMVVGFEVMPCSVNHKFDEKPDFTACELTDPSKWMEVKEEVVVPYTYDVKWQLSDIPWSSRWDAYLKMPGGRVHWFSIINSMLVVLVMAIVCAMILIRTVRRDLSQYEELIMESGAPSEIKEEAGWKLVSGDVFRTPQSPIALAVRVGSGVQIILTTLVTVFFAMIGFLSPASRGSLVTALLVLYLLLASSAGFVSVWLSGIMMRTHNGWRGLCWRVSTYFPGIVFLVFTSINILIKHTGSTGAVPLRTFFSILTLWFLVSIPLTFVGGYFATKMTIVDYPARTNQIPRHIPKPPLTTHPVSLFAIAGLLPFGTLFIELYFIMTSLWMGFFYYLFGYLFIIGLLTFIVTVEVAVLCTYVQLCAEDYRWWWSSFWRGGSIAFYIMVYAIGFLVTTLHSLSGGLSVILYIAFMTVFVFGVFLASGTIGFLSSMLFTYWIFRSVKLD